MKTKRSVLTYYSHGMNNMYFCKMDSILCMCAKSRQADPTARLEGCYLFLELGLLWSIPVKIHMALQLFEYT